MRNFGRRCRMQQGDETIDLVDHGKAPYVVNINRAAVLNNDFRLALWTGTYLQTTLMSIQAGGEIGAEVHPKTDQLIVIVTGKGLARLCASGTQMGEYQLGPGSTVFIPAGTRHNIINTGSAPLKLYSVYAPPEHPFGTKQKTKADADMAE